MIEFEKIDLFFVTGAGSGIGRQIAKQIMRLGGSVLGIGRNEDKLIILKDEFPNSFNYEMRDLSNEIEDIPAWFAELTKKYGRVRGLVLSAGVQDTRPISILKLDVLLHQFNTNLFSNLFIIKAFAKKSNRAEGNTSVVTISSLASERGIPGISIYSASKGGLNSAVKSLAVELAKDKIRINAILPGHVETEMLTKDNKFFSEDYLAKLKSKYPLGLGTTEQVANFACYLLSDASGWTTGANYIIDGGASVSF